MALKTVLDSTPAWLIKGTVDSTIDHLLKFTRIGFKSNLLRHRQRILLDHLAAPVHAEGPQALLLVILHGFSNSLLLLILEIRFRHGDDVLLIKLICRHDDLDLEFCPTERAKRCVDAKVDIGSVILYS